MKYLFYIFIVYSLLACSTWDTRLTLVNSTNKKIRFLFEFKTLADSIPEIKDCQITNPYYIQPDTEQIILSQNKWDLYFKYHPKELLRIYIIGEDTLSKYGLCNIIKNQIFMKRFDLTYDDIIKANWRIVYDGK